MASYHFTMKTVSFGKGQSAVATAAYNARTQFYNERNGYKTNDYSRASVAAFAGVFAPKDAPAWAHDREQLWNRAEASERQRNGRPARNVEFALPHELTDQQREWLVKDFVREAMVRKGMAADAAIHRPHRKSDERNHHVHILVTTKAITAEGFAATKNREWNRRETLEEWREKLAILGARALERAGHKIEAQRFRHGHETLEKQRAAALARGDLEFAAGLDREPSRHVGVTATSMERKGIRTERGDLNRAVQERNRERAGLEKELKAVTKEIESEHKTTFRDELGAAFAQQRDEKAEVRLAGWQARTADREIHRDAATVEREADKVVSTAERTVDKAAHAGGVVLGGLKKAFESVVETLGDLVSPPPPMTHDQAERAERAAEEKHDEAAVADEAAAKEARLQELLAQMARDDAERRRQREERGGRDDDDDRGRERDDRER
jgi:ATP-dependent exoDNAse (exonuclease V) alpha subunit